MDDQQKEQEVFRQNLNEKGNFQTLFQIYLLFTQKSTHPDGKEVQKALLSKFEKVDIVANVKDSLSTFAIWKYIVEYKDNQRLPAQVLMSDFENFDGNNVDLSYGIARKKMRFSPIANIKSCFPTSWLPVFLIKNVVPC